MKSKGKKIGFTIIELLTVMSIIIILIAMLVPSLNAIRRYAKVVTQKGQFHNISKGLELFSIDFDGYLDSSAGDFDSPANHYCGAMKLCEAMVGQDGLGFHPDSVFDDEGKAIDGTTELYFNRTTPPSTPPTAAEEANLRTRKVKYMEGKDVQIASIETVFLGDVGVFDVNCPILCDVFKRTDLRAGTEKLGMPVLYYKADTSKLTHDANEIGTWASSGTNIYNYWDNHELVKIPPPWAPSTNHPMYDSTGKSQPFYSNTKDNSVTIMDKPHNPGSFILISAGWDGLYGTRDDVYNFEE